MEDVAKGSLLLLMLLLSDLAPLYHLFPCPSTSAVHSQWVQILMKIQVAHSDM